MVKVICDLDKITHVIINGTEYERFVIKKGGNPQGKAILLGLPCSLTTVPPSKKAVEKNPLAKPFEYYAQIGSAFGLKPIKNNKLGLTFAPIPDGVITNSNESEFDG